jgi:hypothetical protein
VKPPIAPQEIMRSTRPPTTFDEYFPHDAAPHNKNTQLLSSADE